MSRFSPLVIPEDTHVTISDRVQSGAGSSRLTYEFISKDHIFTGPPASGETTNAAQNGHVKENSGLSPPASGETVNTGQDGFDCVRDDPAFKSGSGSLQAKKRRSSEQEEGQAEKKKKISALLEDITGEKRKLLHKKEGPRKKSRVSEEEEAHRSSLEPPKERRAYKLASSNKIFEKKYRQLNLLGEGGFGSVYAGYRRKDHLPVAIKRIPKDSVSYYKGMIPLEVAVMQKLTFGQEVGKSGVISVLDYYDWDQEIVLVLERPVPAVDLYEYIEDRDEALRERESCHILKQLVEVASEVQSKRVFHGNIKLENILIETNSDAPRIRLIDFGLSCFAKKSAKYRTFDSTSEHIPPEWHNHGTYTAGPTTVWQIGVVLYDLMHWGEDLFETTKFFSGEISIRADLSTDCQDMLRRCLAEDPNLRPSLEELCLHPWLA
ncbi:serine/threonine-protein kinase pim-1-like [Cheilinus undulatus]|uniref:serine/threonine-protein kinase pim-1-like n=1 Tax=Cheilinus undulatus TaxID=241271 RepID=UPI001BD27546|nr:serine/threonine-protein kinase pim-1-like [Cheilinus undulatus]